MSRGFISIGPGGPRFGVVISGRGMARAFLTLAIPFGAMALFGGATDKYGVFGGAIAASALIALLWFACTRPPGKGPLLSDKEAGATQRVANGAARAWCDWCNKRP